MAQRGSKPGERRGGRQKGTPNKTTQLLKDAILLAAERVGDPLNGRKGGTVGYLEFLATSEPKAFAGLLGRVLPTQIEGTGDGGSFNVVIRNF